MERHRAGSGRAAASAVGLMLAATVSLSALTACRGHVEASLTYPPPQLVPQEPPPSGILTAPLGVYFLHEDDPGLEGCAFVGERVTGGPQGAGHGGTEQRGDVQRGAEAEQSRARAVLDLAEEARWLGGNVVLLPSFREDFYAGQLQGRVYRCDEPQRRAIYERAAAAQQLTVVPPP